jgi:hypothetical protein
MTKAQLLEASRSIGKDIAKLVNEYRNSEGEVVDHDETYFQDYFAGYVAWLCTGNGEATIEYSRGAEPNSSFIDGEIAIEAEVGYLFNDAHIHDFKNQTERTSMREGQLDKSFKLTMDPITFLYYLMGTNYMGRKLFDGNDVRETVI